MYQQLNVMIIAGEASGDLHGSHLVREMQQLAPNLAIKGLGGTSMQAAGVELLHNINDISVCGFLEVIRYLPKLIKLFYAVKKRLLEEKPHLLILIDYPTFNLRLASIAKKHGIKVLYYISPQIWAWHTSRIVKIKHAVDRMAVIFPFEREFYKQHKVAATYVGHPLVDIVKVPPTGSRSDPSGKSPVIGLLPGSRQNEIKYILPTLIQAANLLGRSNPAIKFILPLADTVSEAEINPCLAMATMPIQVIREHRYEAMSDCSAVIAASGTVTLELTLLGVPMVIIYKSSRLSFALAKRLVKIPHIGLCNIVAQREIVTELLQENANPENIATEVHRLLTDDNYRQVQQQALAGVANALRAQKECSIGQLAISMLHNHP